jgi:hypothetical protein
MIFHSHWKEGKYTCGASALAPDLSKEKEQEKNPAHLQAIGFDLGTYYR